MKITVYDPMSELHSQRLCVQTTHQETSQLQTGKRRKPTEQLE